MSPRKVLPPAGPLSVSLLLMLAAGCSFSDKGIGSQTTGGTAGSVGTGGAPGTGGQGGTIPGVGGSVGSLDGSAAIDAILSGDLPPAPADVPAPPLDAPPMANGSACTADGQCVSGFCTDGLCCDKRCGEACFACRGGKTGEPSGLCRPDITLTACGPASCNGNVLTAAPRCEGGACKPAISAACPNNLTCAGTACKTRCAANGDCANGMVCDVPSGQCRVPGKANGVACAAGTECMSGNCADRVCCDAPCTGVCRACTMAQTGQPNGRCAPVAAGTPDSRCAVQAPSTCGTTGLCGANGACARHPNGTICGSGCCRADGGGTPGGTVAAVCNFRCQAGVCSRDNPVVVDRCGGGQCCCPNAGQPGAPACLLVGALCPSMCVN